MFPHQEPHCHVWWSKMSRGKARDWRIWTLHNFQEIYHGSLSYVVYPSFPEWCNVWHLVVTKSSLARVSKLPSACFWEHSSQPRPWGRADGVVEVKEQLTRDSLHQPLFGRKELVTGMGVPATPATFKFRSRWLQFGCKYDEYFKILGSDSENCFFLFLAAVSNQQPQRFLQIIDVFLIHIWKVEIMTKRICLKNDLEKGLRGV